MARAKVWTKEWIPSSASEIRYSAPDDSFTTDKENASVNLNIESKSRFSMGSSKRRMSQISNFTNETHGLLDADDDVGSTVSALSLLERLPQSVADDGSCRQVISVLRENTNQIASQISEWFCTIFRKESPVVYDGMSHLTAMFELLENGELVYELVRKSGLVSAIQHRKIPTTEGEERVTALFKIIQEICATMGIPENYVIQPRDRTAVRVIGCVVLLSRVCRARNPKIIALNVSSRALEKINIRVDEMTCSNSHPALDELKLRGAFWVPDSFSTVCMICELPFGSFRGKHHCRSCGILCCASCSPGREMCLGYAEKERICEQCVLTRQLPSGK